MNLEERIAKGRALIANWKQIHGSDNQKYLDHLARLEAQQESERKVVQIRDWRQSDQEKQILADFRKLLKMKPNTRNYNKQEMVVRRQLRKNLDLFDVIYNDKGEQRWATHFYKRQ